MDQYAAGTVARRSYFHSQRSIFRAAIMVGIAWTGITRAAETAPNILFFGNSFTHAYSPKDLPTLLSSIYQAAGKPTGLFFRRTGSGYSFGAHLQSTGVDSVEYLATQTLPAGQQWDYVILQGNSVESTTEMGNPAQFLQNGKAIFDIIAQSNPSAKAVTFETWARNANVTGFYPTPFANPAAMQTEVATNYRTLYHNLLDAYGSGSARYAGVGDAFAGLNWPNAIYNSDWYHANNRGELLIALTIYGSLNGPTAAQLARSGALDALATSIGLTPADVLPMAIAADAAGVSPGDTDLDWDVDFDDLLTVAQTYGSRSDELRSLDWFAGDFDANGRVDFDDLLPLAQHYGSGLVPVDTSLGGGRFAADWSLARSLVPEPACAALFVGCCALPRRRR